MNYTYQIHLLVEKDFEEGYIWYEERQKGLGERFINAVDAKTLPQSIIRKRTLAKNTVIKIV